MGSRHHNSVSPTSSDDIDVSEHVSNVAPTIAHVKSRVNGDNVTLQYPIVTTSDSNTRNNYEPWTMTLRRKTKKFLGIEEDGDEDRETLWRVRRIRMANR